MGLSIVIQRRFHKSILVDVSPHRASCYASIEIWTALGQEMEIPVASRWSHTVQETLTEYVRLFHFSTDLEFT